MQEGKLIDRKTEIRQDPLTGETSRIIFNPGATFVPEYYEDLAKESEGEKCPFCPENVHTFTPSFPGNLIEGGRIIKNEAIAFPNLFPYSKHNAVVRMTDQHYVKLDEFSKATISNSFIAAMDYLNKVHQDDSLTTFASINWNYLPPSGGSILHPHIHVLASEHPTNYQALIQRASEQYYQTTGDNYFTMLTKQEHELKERSIGTIGAIDWIHAYAPKGHTDFIGVFDAKSIDDIDNQVWQDLAASMIRFFNYFEEIGIASFNLGVFIPLQNQDSNQIHIRIIPRLTIGALQTSDMNVFNYLHNEPLCLLVPEQTTKDVSRFFNK